MDILKMTTIVVVGLMVGVELSVAAFLNPIFDRLPENGGLSARSDGARLLGRVMPVWYIASVVLGAPWAAQVWGQGQGRLVVGAAALLLLSVVMSVLLLVPINSRVADWTAQRAPADWRQQIGRWDSFHYARVGIIVLAFVLLVAAGVSGSN